MGLFNSKPRRKKPPAGKSKVTEHDRAVLDLKNARDRLRRYQKRLQAEAEKMQQQALVLVREGRKERALVVLKIKKYKLAQLENADKQLLTVSEMIETIAWETQQLKVFDALKAGNAALDKLQQEMPIEDVESLMADTAEALAYEQEVSRAIADSWVSGEDEAELEAELDELEKEMAGEAALAEPQSAKAAEPPVPAAVAAELEPAKEVFEPVAAPAPATVVPAAAAAAAAEPEALDASSEEAREAASDEAKPDAGGWPAASSALDDIAAQLPEVPSHIPVVSLPAQPLQERERSKRELVAA